MLVSTLTPTFFTWTRGCRRRWFWSRLSIRNFEFMVFRRTRRRLQSRLSLKRPFFRNSHISSFPLTDPVSKAGPGSDLWYCMRHTAPNPSKDFLHTVISWFLSRASRETFQSGRSSLRSCLHCQRGIQLVEKSTVAKHAEARTTCFMDVDLDRSSRGSIFNNNTPDWTKKENLKNNRKPRTTSHFLGQQKSESPDEGLCWELAGNSR